MKEQIDIEGLLEWAYRVQCVERRVRRVAPRGPASYPPSAPFAAFADLGTRVSTSGFQALDVAQTQVEDAVLVHDAVLALENIWLEWRDHGGEVVFWTRAEAATLGFEIVQSGRDGWVLDKSYLGEGEIWLPVRLQLVSRAVLVIVHGRVGSRPDWHEGWIAGVGAPRRDKARDKWGRRRKDALRTSQSEVMFDRAQYMLWHGALCALRAALTGRLAKFEVTGPVADLVPWESGASPAQFHAA